MNNNHFPIQPKIHRSISILMLLISFCALPLFSANPKIVILPFQKLNKEKNADLDVLGLGISDTLAGALSTVKGFIIVDAERVKKYLSKEIEFTQAIGAEADKKMDTLRKLASEKLEGDYIIYGTFQKIASLIRINAKFVAVISGQVVTSESVHGKFPDNIFDLQDVLARKLAEAISKSFSGETVSILDKDHKDPGLEWGTIQEQAIQSISNYTKSTENYSAYQEYLLGRKEHLTYTTERYSKALEHYKRAIELDKNYFLAYTGVAEVSALWSYQIEYAKGDYLPLLNQAVDFAQKALNLGGKNLYQTYRALGNAYLMKRQFPKAREYAKKAFKLKENDPEILWLLAQLENYGFKDMATSGTVSNKYILKALEINPDLVIARWSLAHSYYTLRDYDNAIIHYKKILEVNPEHDASLHTLAIIYNKKKQYEQAEHYALLSAKYGPKVPQHFVTLGLTYHYRALWEKAEEAYQKAVELNPNYEEAQYNIGLTYYKRAKYQKAVDYFKKAVRIKPKYENAQYMIGLSYYNHGEYDDSLEAMQKTLDINSKNVDALQTMGSCYYNKKNYKKAVEYYSKALAIDPNYSLAKTWKKKAEEKLKGE